MNTIQESISSYAFMIGQKEDVPTLPKTITPSKTSTPQKETQKKKEEKPSDKENYMIKHLRKIP